jgi:hypothetical protein
VDQEEEIGMKRVRIAPPADLKNMILSKKQPMLVPIEELKKEEKLIEMVKLNRGQNEKQPKVPTQPKSG